MRIYLFPLVVTVALGMGACQTVTQNGKGPVTLSPRALASFYNYKDEERPLYFALANDGLSGNYSWCDISYTVGCVDDGGRSALSLCDRAVEGRGTKCSLFAMADEVVWDGPVAYAGTTDDYLLTFKRIIAGGSRSSWGKGNSVPGGHKIAIRFGQCRGEANLGTKKWFMKDCKNDYAASGTLAAGKGSQKYVGTGHSHEGGPVRIQFIDPFSDPRFAKATVSTSNRKNPAGNSMAAYPASDVCKEALAADGQRWMTSHPGWVTEALRRDLTVGKCAAMLGRENSTPPAARTAKNASSPAVRPIAIEWEGYGKLIAGQIELDQRQDGGKISLQLPNEEGSCTGSYNFSSKTIGNWALACTNGMAATGRFESLGSNKGSVGEGTDTKGRTIRYTIGAGPR